MNILQLILQSTKKCRKHQRVNCPDPDCNPKGTAADHIMREAEKEAENLKPVKNERTKDSNQR